MKVLLITHGAYLQKDQVVAGNSMRAYFLAHGLIHHGIQVVHIYPRALGAPKVGQEAPATGITLRVYATKTELEQIISEESPDMLLIGYWEMLEELPESLSIPIMLDVVGPRVLEVMYQADRSLQEEIQRMLRVYRKVDRFLVGNERQRHFLLPWLIMAGFDCRDSVPIDIVPISTKPGEAHVLSSSKTSWRFVSGGVIWPWRRTTRYFDSLVNAITAMPGIDVQLILLSGKYVYDSNHETLANGRESAWPESIVKQLPLLPYGEMEGLLTSQCDIGVELADRNIEREYSQSFRSIEFLRSGLPIICNDYLELAECIRKYDAGWIIHDPEDIPAVLKEILAAPVIWAEKAKNAIHLIDEQLNYLKTIEPILHFIRTPHRPLRGMSLLNFSTHENTDVKIDTPKYHSPKSVLVHTLGHIFKRIRRNSGPERTVAIISRADIFPPDHGAAVKIERTAWGLSYWADSALIITDDRRRYFVYQRGKLIRQSYPFWLSLFAPPRFWVRKSLLKLGIPPSDAFLYYPLKDWSYIIRTIYLSFRYPIIAFQSEFPAYARAALWGRSLFGGKSLIVEHNIEYERLKEQVPDLSPQTYNFLKHIELMLCNQVDAVITVSKRDQQCLAAAGVDYRRLYWIPHGVDLEQFDQAKPIDLQAEFGIAPDQKVLVYHGIYLYPPNLEAMEVLAQEILPHLNAKGLYPKVLAIGRNPPREKLHEDIIFTGSVDSVAPYLLAADLAVVPSLKGGGTRMKVLDYFAAGLPVVSTPKGVEGIPVKNGVHAIIENDYDMLVIAIMELLNDSQKAKRLGEAGKAFVKPLAWREISRKYWSLIAD